MAKFKKMKFLNRKHNHQPFRIPRKRRKKVGSKKVIDEKGNIKTKPKKITFLDPTNDLKTYYEDYVNHSVIKYTYHKKKHSINTNKAIEQISYNSDLSVKIGPTNSIYPFDPTYRMTQYGSHLINQTLKEQRCCLVSIGTGGGKTYMAINAAGKTNPKAILLVIAPLSVCSSHNWENSIAAYNRETGKHLSCIVVNYSKVRTKLRFEFLSDLLYILKRRFKSPIYLVLDEAHNTKNKTGVTTYAIRNLFNKMPLYKMICLTATAASNSLLDYGSYLIYAGFYRNQSDFYRHHVYKNMVNTQFGYQPIVKDKSGRIHNEWLKNLPLLKKNIRKISIKLSTKKYLPPVKYIQKQFHMTDLDQYNYSQIAAEYHEGRFDSVQAAISAQNKFIAQHCKQRMHYIKRFITSKYRPNTPILIFYQYVEDYRQLAHFFKTQFPSWHIQRIDGRITPDERIRNTQKPSSPHTVVLIQYESGSEGLNAQWSRCSIFYAPTTSYQLFKQSRGRNVRAMQKGTVYQVRLFVKNTLNGKIWQRIIDQKQAFTKNVARELLNDTAKKSNQK